MRWHAQPGQKITVDGVGLEVACYGPPPGKAPTLVMLHEGLGCVALWRDVPQQLSEATGLGVFVYSRRGYGASEAGNAPYATDYMTREAEDVLCKVLNAAGLGDVILLGHSDGASIACIYAGSVSDMRVRGLILIAPHFFVEPAGLAAIRQAGDDFRSGDLRAKLARYHDHVDDVFYGWHDVWTSPAFGNWNVADAIDHLRIPVLAIQGRSDPYGTLAQIDEIEARIYSPLETLVLEGCGHAPHLEHRGATAQAITEFCARLIRLEQATIALA
ncbi:2-succinyl-6-hydroxy-2,4-cyclohexadiene-1-carboxylate synthase [Roseobacter fucihabitans]|uniref:2-succinyl-6-hydroxy-2, 4-cyclohexadiene-1-carboxylate synthase n=1 Tax=Roseobacter fucihabitans TaxID=1537242 RepID=A0ABZ2BZH9_9RHOB|nr:alpha/beta hydrolase [Roseobacter litoralis]MBC6966341.1 2-succinyl-6-hydroxy-2,4-cyclohexadiene-1-carboxylate synthase [Roseobacter litoralis]